jgi:glycosyltransferase involved in cell wall biosynthesis
MLAGLGETWVITRKDYEATIKQALSSLPERDRLRFVYVDLPPGLRGWQHGLRGLRVYYFLWQIAALRKARRLSRDLHFDLVWHLTWATAWYGSLAALAGKPFVYGPVGGSVGTVWRLLPALGWNGALYEVARSSVHGVARYLNPLARLSWRRADLILAQNPETRDWFPRVHRDKAWVFPNAVLSEEQISAVSLRGRSEPPVALFAGRLEPFKGMFLCLHALALLPEWKLVVCGSGTDERRLRRLARRLGVEDRVGWLGWLTQDRVLAEMSNADILLFPCLHEEAGAVVAEARAAGLPIVCLARGGPPILAGPAGIAVADTGGVAAIARRLADASLSALERRRGEVEATNIETLSLQSQTEDLRGLLTKTLQLYRDDPGGLRLR